MCNICKSSCALSRIGYYLMAVGAINWGIVGIGYFMNINLNLVHLLFGTWPALEAIVYILVGAAAVFMLIGCRCAKCQTCFVAPVAPVSK